MSINFFQAECQQQLNHELFGLCDAQNNTKAYPDINNPNNWIATVKNNRNLNLIFIAVDKCIIKDDEQEGRGRCDGLLISSEHIYFIELKDQKKNWKPNAIIQLESTIEFFIDNHDISIYRHKKAFVCNKQHKHFKKIDNEFKLRFFRTYGVRIDIQADIIII